MKLWAFLLLTVTCGAMTMATTVARAGPPHPSTFSIVAADPETREVGIAVASKFFAVGTVVPHAIADVGAVATQSFANTTYGPRGLQLLSKGLTPDEVLTVLLRDDEDRGRRQVGVVSADGSSATATGEGCIEWAGGRHGPGYAAQGNILTGEDVVAEMERAFLESAGRPLAERLYASLRAGDAAGGDSRGRQSAAILVVRARGGYAGFTDRAIDVRVDDHTDPLGEIGRLLRLALVNDYWNRGWTAFTEERYTEALMWQQRATSMAEQHARMLPEVLYDLAVIQLANGARDEALAALRRSMALNPKLAGAARKDTDLEGLWAEIGE